MIGILLYNGSDNVIGIERNLTNNCQLLYGEIYEDETVLDATKRCLHYEYRIQCDTFLELGTYDDIKLVFGANPTSLINSTSIEWISCVDISKLIHELQIHDSLLVTALSITDLLDKSIKLC